MANDRLQKKLLDDDTQLIVKYYFTGCGELNLSNDDVQLELFEAIRDGLLERAKAKEAEAKSERD